jgi:carboxypeptidase D
MVVAGLLCATAPAQTDLHWAARTGQLAVLASQLAQGAEMDARDQEGMTPLLLAAQRGHPEMVRLLLAAGADVGARDRQGRTALHYAAMSGDREVLVELLGAGAEVDIRDLSGETALHLAARRFRAEAVDVLLAAGADPNAANAAGQTPLHVLGSAAREPDERFVEQLYPIAARLIAAGADPSVIAGGFPALQAPEEQEGEELGRDTWPTYAEIGPTLLSYETAYPSLCKRYDLGLSYQGRHLWAVRISDNVLQEEDEPEFKYISTMHGDEITGVKMCLNLVDYLLTNYGSIPQVTNLVNQVEIWIVPLMNPDGYDRSPRTRTNAQGIDLNRDFPDPYTSPNNTPDGRATETQVIMNWSFQHTFTLSANFHGGALVVNYPFDNNPSGSDVYTPTPDDDLFIWVSEEYSRHNLPMWNSSTFYHGITNGAAWYAISGGMQDWNYHYMGNNEVTIELGTKEPPASQIPTLWNDNRDSMLAYMDTCLIGVRGIISDVFTGLPVEATVTVVNRDHEIYSDPQVGDYHRMLLPGTYDLHFEADGYDPITVLNVVVASGQATRLDVPMSPPPQITYPNGGETLQTGVPVNVTWVGNPVTPFHVQCTANYGQTQNVNDGFESGTFDPAYTTGGNQPWFITTSSAHSGSRSARAGAITHSQLSWLKRSATGGPLSFWYRVSSQSNYDWFNFYIDDTRVVHRSGTVSWTSYSTTLTAGPHELKWEYVKDQSTSSGSDTVWIDDLSLTADVALWTDIIALTEPGANSTAWTPTQVSTSCKVRVQAYYGGGYGNWDESNGTFTVVQGPTYPRGDMNCDSQVDFKDINPFVLALSDPAAYHTAFPDCLIQNGDINQDGQVDFRDINPFVALLVGRSG